MLIRLLFPSRLTSEILEGVPLKMRHIWLLHNWASPHFRPIVHEYLNNVFEALLFFLWSNLKRFVCRDKEINTLEL